MRDVYWMGDSLERLSSFPNEVKREMGYALRMAQSGETHETAKLYKGYPGVFELVSPFMTDTFRAVYALKVGTRIYVLHAYQKKSNRKSKVPKRDKELIEARFKAAKRLEEDNV
jgi:phage-related protein